MSVPQLVEDLSAAVESELRAVAERCAAPLHRLVAFEMGWQDETGEPQVHVRPSRATAALCLLACRAVRGSHEPALPAAAAVELINSFALVHGDVQAGNPNRGGRATVWWQWGPAQAINAGDAIHALARLSLMSLQERGVADERVLEALATLDRATLSLCEGQHQDLTYQERLTITEETYLRMASEKSGALMGCALALGAYLGDASTAAVAAFDEAGRKLGMAFQVRRDLLDLWPPNSSAQDFSADVLNKKKSLPVIHGFAASEPSRKRELGNYYLKRVLEPQDAKEVAEILERLGARQHAEDVVQRLVGEAMALLDGAGLEAEGLADLKTAARLCASNGI